MPKWVSIAAILIYIGVVAVVVLKITELFGYAKQGQDIVGDVIWWLLVLVPFTVLMFRRPK